MAVCSRWRDVVKVVAFAVEELGWRGRFAVKNWDGRFAVKNWDGGGGGYASEGLNLADLGPRPRLLNLASPSSPTGQCSPTRRRELRFLSLSNLALNHPPHALGTLEACTTLPTPTHYVVSLSFHTSHFTLHTSDCAAPSGHWQRAAIHSLRCILGPTLDATRRST